MPEDMNIRSQGTMASQERIAIISEHMARFHQKVWDPKEQAFELYQSAAALEDALYRRA